MQQLGACSEKVNKDSKGNPQPTGFLGLAENWSENPCHEEEQPQCCFKLQKLSHPQTVQAYSCLDSLSPIAPFTQAYFGRVSQRCIKMHKWKEVPNAGLSSCTVFTIWSQTSLTLPSCSFQNTLQVCQKRMLSKRESIIYCLESSPSHFSRDLVMGCTFMPPITKQHLPLCTLHYKYDYSISVGSISLQPDSTLTHQE